MNQPNQSVQLPMLNGYNICGFKDDHITNAIQKHGVFEKELYSLLHSFLQMPENLHQAICIDVGANIGCHTLTMAKQAKQVIAYEPIPFVFDLLQKTIMHNKINNIIANNKALSNANKETIVHVNLDGNVGASSIDIKGTHSQPQPIHCVIGDHALSKYNLDRVDILKIDVEGHEPEVILGLRHTIQQHRPVIILEWNCNKTRADFLQYNLFKDLFNDFQTKALLSNHQYCRTRLKKNLLTNPFRGLLTSLYKRYSIKKTILSNFFYHSDYDHILIIPNEKMPLITKAIEAIEA